MLILKIIGSGKLNKKNLAIPAEKIKNIKMTKIKSVGEALHSKKCSQAVSLSKL